MPFKRQALEGIADGSITLAFRRLREPGLTESLETGYRLSLRGEAVTRTDQAPDE